MPELKPRPKIVQRGQSSFSALSTSVDIPFPNSMPGTNYKVFYRQLSGVAVSLPTTSNATRNGFRAGIGVGVAATFEYLVIED